MSADILWHNSSTGGVEIWTMDGARVKATPTVRGTDGKPASVGSTWGIVGAGDFDGDGRADILWHDRSNGMTQVWFMDGARVKSRGTVVGTDGKPAYIGPPWGIV